jgi:hypothetical protein
MGRGRALKRLCVKLLESLDVAFAKGAFARGFRYYAHRDIQERRVGEVPLQRAPVVMRKLFKERTLPYTAFIKPCEQPLFIGGITGRTGTTWVKNILRNQASGAHEVIGEIGFFDLSQFRGAPYEFYQRCSFPRDRALYVSYFRDFVLKRAYFRNRRMRGGLRGLCDLLPQRGVKIALDQLQEELGDVRRLEECQLAFGRFYLWLFNFRSAIAGRNRWISKEPSYGRRADQLFAMIPNARLVVMARDGRDTALAMFRDGRHPTVRDAIGRWRSFTKMALKAVEQCPPRQYLMVRYEDLVLSFPEKINEIFNFFDIDGLDIPSLLQNPVLRPSSSTMRRWEAEMSKEDQDHFASTCSSLMTSLGYEV